MLAKLSNLVLGKKKGDKTGQRLEAGKASGQFLCKWGSG